MPEDIFGVLASPVRRQLLSVLRTDGPQPVQDLAAHFAMQRPSVSEHLKVLREAGLVVERKQGRQRICALDARPLSQVEEWLRPYAHFWRSRLASLREVLDMDADADADARPPDD